MCEWEDVEADEMWSFVEKKSEQRWLWHAIVGVASQNENHQTGEILAYIFGTHQDRAFIQLKSLLEPFGHYAILYRCLGSL
jgi:insertion element IS1 protein InsB